MDVKREWYNTELTEGEHASKHRPLEEEYTFYQAVKTGDLDYVRKNCNDGVFGNSNGMGILSKDSIRNLKYHFVITVALITRYCVEGGMELEHAYRLSDFYILKMDGCQTIEEIISLHTNMALDYTGKMMMLQKNSVLSKPITLCIDYIYNHIHDRITIQALAEYTGLSSSYLSKLFKKELGVSASDYIREKKIETAENLLKFSEYSLIEISNYLAFSSQSHFIQTFEKIVGTTPKKYRDRYYRTSW